MKPPAFDYHDPRSKGEALRLLSAERNAMLLAGGQSLMPMLNFRAVSPDHVIDVNRIPELTGIEVVRGSLRIEAMTRQHEIERSETVSKTVPLLQSALAHVGHVQTRNRGTIGGSLCHLDPSAELVTAAAALDATLIAEHESGVRRIPIGDWCKGYLTNALGPGEMLCAIEMPIWGPGHGHAFVEYARRRGDFAIVGVAALMALDSAECIERVAIAVGGCGPSAQRVTAVESALLGSKPDATLFGTAARLTEKLETMSDAYVTAAYRAHLAPILIERALAEATRRALEGEVR